MKLSARPRSVSLALVFVVSAAPAMAAPFCLAGSGMQMKQCVYEDLASCLAEANPPATSCIANPDFPLMMAGLDRFCVVTNARSAECYYADNSTCQQAAKRSNGICIARQPGTDTDPFRHDPRRAF